MQKLLLFGKDYVVGGEDMDHQIKQVLELFAQPAFLALDGTVIWCNSACGSLLPVGAGLASFLEDDTLYTMWDRTGTLQLALAIAGEEYNASVCLTSDGELFVASRRTTELSVTAKTVVKVSATLRRPLHQMISATDALFETLDEASDPKLVSAASRLNQAVYRILRLCGQMSDGGGLLLHRREARRLPTEVSGFFREFAGQVGPLVESAGVHFCFENLQAPMQADLDAALLERALYNLVSNALSYCHSGGTITLRLERQQTHLAVSVSDDGEGISPTVLATLFERFSEHPVGDSRWGLGLGLPMVQEIARLHNGTLSIRDNGDQRGTTVTLSISLEPVPISLHSQAVGYDYCSGYHHGLVELSDVLDAEMFNPNEVL